MNRGLVASARKKLLRRGRALLRGTHGRPDTLLGQMADADVAELREIHAALERIERGIFGRCDTCESPVEEQRLEHVPWERHCATCRGEEMLAEPSSDRASA
jgi:RNA polymerase-binding transcription factor DksA